MIHHVDGSVITFLQRGIGCITTQSGTGVAPSAMAGWHEALGIPVDQIWHLGRIPIPAMPRDAIPVTEFDYMYIQDTLCGAASPHDDASLEDSDWPTAQVMPCREVYPIAPSEWCHLKSMINQFETHVTSVLY